MRFGFVIVLALILSMGGALATTTANLTLHEALIVDGTLSLSSPTGGVDLVPRTQSRASTGLSWASAQATVHQIEWLVAGGWNVSLPNPTANDETIEAGQLTSIQCQRLCSALLYTTTGGIVSVAGKLTGPLVRADEAVAYWAEASSGANHTFRHEFPPGSTLLGTNTKSGAMEGNATAAGSLFLFASNARLTFTSTNGTSSHMELRDDSEPVVGPLGDIATRVVSRFAVIELTDPQFDSPLSDIRLILPDAQGTSAGVLVAPDTSGTMLVGDRKVTLDHARLLLAGDVRISLNPNTPDETLLPPHGQWDHQSLSTQGDAEVWVNGRLMVARTTSDMVSESLTAIAFGAFLVALRFILPLYSRISRDRVLSNPNRRALWGRLVASPGQSTTGLARDLGLARVVVRHHLAMLASHGLVGARPLGRSRRYYPLGALPSETTMLQDELKTGSTRWRITQALVSIGEGTTQSAISRLSGVSPRLVSYHLGCLEQRELVESRGSWRRTYRPTRKLVEAFLAASESMRTEKV